MNIEEKIKHYDEAIERAKKWLNAPNVSKIPTFANRVIKEIFPELKESEDEKMKKIISDILIVDNDEIRKILDSNDVLIQDVWAWLEKQDDKSQYWKPSEEQLEALDYAYNSCPDTEKGNYYEGVLGTIIEDLHKLSEKQGKQKPDKVEPKFKVEKEKWYVCISQYCNCIEGRNYKASLDGRIIDDYGTEYDMHDDAYRWFRPWTIQDAKDGDVLFMDNGSANCIFIYKSSNNGIINKYASYNKFGFECEHYLVLNDGYVIPATKEQRDTLMKAMTDAGYTFDFVKKELKKIKQDSIWSEEDDYNLQCMIAKVTSDIQKGNVGRNNELIDWLKSLKDRYTWKPSDEQMEVLWKYAEQNNYDGTLLTSLYNDLKKLREK